MTRFHRDPAIIKSPSQIQAAPNASNAIRARAVTAAFRNFMGGQA